MDGLRYTSILNRAPYNAKNAKDKDGAGESEGVCWPSPSIVVRIPPQGSTLTQWKSGCLTKNRTQKMGREVHKVFIKVAEWAARESVFLGSCDICYLTKHVHFYQNQMFSKHF